MKTNKIQDMEFRLMRLRRKKMDSEQKAVEWQSKAHDIEEQEISPLVKRISEAISEAEDNK